MSEQSYSHGSSLPVFAISTYGFCTQRAVNLFVTLIKSNTNNSIIIISSGSGGGRLETEGETYTGKGNI